MISAPNRACVAPAAGTPTLPATIGYVKVDRFSGIGPEAAAFANGIQQAIMSADRDDLIGWIVDVRGNLGGNMWPMVAGVGPVLGEGVIGYFIDPTGVENVWEYRDGASWDSGVAQQRVDAPYRLRRESAASGRAHRRRRRQLRGSDGHRLQGAPGHAILRHADLWRVDRHRELRHE